MLCERWIVRDHDQGRLFFAHQVHQQLQNRHAVLGVEISRRLIGKQNIGFIDNGAGDGDALLFSTREFRGQMIRSFREADTGECDSCLILRLIAADGTGNHDVFQGGQFGQQVVVLEYVADALIAESGLRRARERIEVDIVDEHFSGLWCLEPGEGVEQCCFAGSTGSAEENFFPAFDRQIYAF